MPVNLDSLSQETRDELASLALNLSNDQKTRKGFLGLVKQANPDVPIPEIDEPSAFQAELAKRDEEFSKYKQEQQNEKLQREIAESKKSAQSKYGLSKDDMEKVEKIMTERKVFNYDDAARLYELEREPAEPTYQSAVGIAELPAAEGIMEDEQRWSLKTAHQMIDEMQKGQRPRF